MTRLRSISTRLARYGGLLLLCGVYGTLAASEPLPDEAPPPAETAAVEFVELGFFEGDNASEIPAWGDEAIQSVFAADESRFIYTLVGLKNNRWNVDGQDVSITVRYYHADGRLLGNPRIDYYLPAEWEFPYLWTGYGWAEPGNWPAGDYRVELWLNDIEKIGEGAFEMLGAVAAPVSAPVEFNRMGFFEGDGNEQLPDGWDDGRVRNNFKKETARFIYTLVNLKNHRWQIDDQRITLRLKYFASDGRRLGETAVETEVPKAWKNAEFAIPDGRAEAGFWPVGRYRVELWLDPATPLGESHFTIHE